MTRQTAWLCPDCDGTGQGDEVLRATWDDPAEFADCRRCNGNGWLPLADGDDSMQPLSARSPGAWNNWLPRYERRIWCDPLVQMRLSRRVFLRDHTSRSYPQARARMRRAPHQDLPA